MLDVDTFLTTLYVITDDFCQSHPPKRHPGPNASLSESEVITLAIFARWSRFASERDFYRYASGHLREAFPTLPDRSQFNRLVRFYTELIQEMALLHLAKVVVLEVGECPYEALDSSAMPVRDAKRRGGGWLAGCADIGWSNSLLGWYEGFRLLAAVAPSGVITGFCFCAASTAADQQAAETAETFFAVRARPTPRLSAWARPLLRDPTSPTTKASRAPTITGGGSIVMERSLSLPAQTQCPQAKMAQALEVLGGRHPPDRGDGLRQTFQHLRPVAGAASRAEWVAGAFGGEGGLAQLLHLAQRSTRSPLVGLR
jgi:hypothetical protein